MVANQKVTGTASSMPAGFAVGILISILTTLGGAALSGYLISQEVLQESAIGYCAMTFILLSTIAGAMVAVAKIKRRRVFVCGMTGLIYFGILLSVTALFFGGQYQGAGVTALLILGGCTLVILLGLRGERTPKYHVRKHNNR